MQYCIGIDVGSRNTKLAILRLNDKKIIHLDYTDSGIQPAKTVITLIEKAKSIQRFKNSDIALIYSTGYGRNVVKSDKVISEITCHTFGVQHYYPDARTIIDIGGQDYKIISINAERHISDFLMNDKCAAGTGRFLEMVAMRLDIPCTELSNLASQSSIDRRLNSTCVVFAESEIIGLISQNISSADIARAVHLSVCDRVVSQVNQMNWENPVVFTGGVALNSDIKRVLSDILKTDIITPPEPELTGAIGAMLVALNDYEQS